MHIPKRYLLLFIVVIAALAWVWHIGQVRTDEERNFSFNVLQLRGVAKLVIWEQNFVLNDVESNEHTYFSWITTKESVATTVNGKMGFHIDLADSVHTHIERQKDTLIVRAPLQVTYVSLDMATLQQVKEASLDPTVKVDEQDVIKHLSQKALQKYLPQITADLKTRGMASQQQQLSRLIGKPVKIVIT